MMIVADQPELLALAGLASVPASKMASAFNDAEHFFEYVTLEELERMRAACDRLGLLTIVLAAALQQYTDAVQPQQVEAPIA